MPPIKTKGVFRSQIVSKTIEITSTKTEVIRMTFTALGAIPITIFVTTNIEVEIKRISIQGFSKKYNGSALKIGKTKQ